MITTGYLSADRIEAGTITTNKLSSEVGEELDLSANTSVTNVTSTHITLAGDHLDIASGGKLNVKSNADINIEGDGDLNVASTGKINVASGGEINVSSGGKFIITSTNFNIDSSGNVS